MESEYKDVEVGFYKLDSLPIARSTSQRFRKFLPGYARAISMEGDGVHGAVVFRLEVPAEKIERRFSDLRKDIVERVEATEDPNIRDWKITVSRVKPYPRDNNL